MRVLLTGASGQLGPYVLDRLADSGHQVVAWSRSLPSRLGPASWRAVDLSDLERIAPALDDADPEVILHAAALSATEAAYRDPVLAERLNVGATEGIAAWCARHRRRLVFTSTDMVFEGTRSWYREDDEPAPTTTYGRTKRDAERAALSAPGALVTRLSLLYGPARGPREGFYDRAVRALALGEPQTFFDDEYRTPLAYVTAAEILVRLLDHPAAGILHVAGRDRLSRFELLRRIARQLGLDTALVLAGSLQTAMFPEPRPRDLALETTRLEQLVPGLDRSPPGPLAS